MTTTAPTARAAKAAAGAAPPAKTVPRKTTAKRPPRKAGPARTDVTLDLDALERERTSEPFTFVLAGVVYLLADPVEMDWQDSVQAIENPARYLDLMLPEEQRAGFYATKMPTWKLQELVKRYLTHFGLPTPGE